MTKMKIVSIGILMAMVLSVFSLFTTTPVTAKTIDFSPNITSFKTKTKNNTGFPLFAGYEVHWTKKNWNKNYDNWKVQYRLKEIVKLSKNKYKIYTTSWIDSNTLAKYQYFVRNPQKYNCKTETTTKKQTPSISCQIRFIKNKDYTKGSNWKKK